MYIYWWLLPCYGARAIDPVHGHDLYRGQRQYEEGARVEVNHLQDDLTMKTNIKIKIKVKLDKYKKKCE